MGRPDPGTVAGQAGRIGVDAQRNDRERQGDHFLGVHVTEVLEMPMSVGVDFVIGLGVDLIVGLDVSTAR